MEGQMILVPLDGSDLAESALPYADALATALSKGIRLISVVDTELERLLPAHVRLSAAAEKARRDAVRTYLDRVESSLRVRGHQVETVAVPGIAAEEILVAAEQEDVAIVVMATHGRGGLQRWVAGSVADKVMRMASRATFLVRPAGAGVPALGSVHLRRLLVPLDGSEFAARALAPAADIALATGATLTLVSVIQHLSMTMDWGGGYVPELGSIEDDLASDAKTKLEELRGGLESSLKAEMVVLRGYPALALEAYATEQDVNLVVMTTHGRGGLRRVALGSMAERLVHAGLPTLLLHSEAPGTDI